MTEQDHGSEAFIALLRAAARGIPIPAQAWTVRGNKHRTGAQNNKDDALQEVSGSK